ncbi:MAG: DedA family protein [Methylococcaceae bacterium]|nr:MAG: DedA family protein [Methylococcaceae bacterium]
MLLRSFFVVETFTSFVDIVLHLDRYLIDVVQNYGPWTLAILFAIVFLETGVVLLPFLPGDSLLFACGALAGAGNLNIAWVFAVLALAAVLGDALNYWIGARIGARAFSGRIRWLNQAHLQRTHDFYEKYGSKTIVLARFVPIVRTFAPFVAGVGSMSYRRFAFYNIAGALLWCVLLLGGGYFFGNLPLVRKNFSLVIVAIIVLSVMPVVYELLRNWRNDHGARAVAETKRHARHDRSPHPDPLPEGEGEQGRRDLHNNPVVKVQS